MCKQQEAQQSGGMGDCLEERAGEQGVPHLERAAAAPRTIVVTSNCPAAMLRPRPWQMEDFELQRQLYKACLLGSKQALPSCSSPVTIQQALRSRVPARARRPWCTAQYAGNRRCR